jgi:hypothetical protein
MRCFQSPMAVDIIPSEEVLICSTIRLGQKFSMLLIGTF